MNLVANVANVLESTTDGLIGLQMGIISASDMLKLNFVQIVMFCEVTPNGEKLWKMFTSRRDSPDTPEGYAFDSFMVEILDKTDYPVQNITCEPSIVK